jgi:MoaA/NifB/PqqE/SkfB family radical SAM enzyme
MSVDGRNYTSNLSRLTKHLGRLEAIQDGRPVSPVMIHMSLTNKCNLDCSYCCYGSRDLKDTLSLEQAMSAIDQFTKLGTRGLELTGGGDPSMSPHMGTVISYAKSKGMDVGLITNGISLDKFGDYAKDLQWMRVSLHGLNYGDRLVGKMGRTVDKAREVNPNIDISSVYIWTTGSEDTIQKVADFTTKYRIPTRVTPDLTLGKDSIDYMMASVGDAMKASGGDYLFLSDFNVKTDRQHDRCYMHLVKPFVFTDGNVYDCPSLALSPENKLNVNDKFKVCSIDDIFETYSQPSKPRLLDCLFCKYSMNNEFIDDLKRDLKHGNFA